MKIRGRGLIYGLELPEYGLASEVTHEAFQNGLVIEVAGGKDQVVKILPPLIIEENDLVKGLEILDQSITSILEKKKEKLTGPFM